MIADIKAAGGLEAVVFDELRNGETLNSIAATFGVGRSVLWRYLKKDPDQLTNVAADPKYKKTKAELSQRLTAELRKTKDPRIIGGGEKFDKYPYLGGAPKFPGLRGK